MVKSLNPCKVCNSPGNGLHFGVDACRGCTSFFRRTIVQEKTYYCNEDESCEIRSDMTQKTVCRKCRFDKCIEVGMKKEAVQKNRDTYGSRKEVALIPSPSNNRFRFPVPSLILEPVGNNYSHLESVRLVVHLDEGTSMFTKRTPKRQNFKETDKLIQKEFGIVIDWILNSFPQIAEFPSDQKNLLLRNFYLQFFILECGFIACKNGRNDVWFLPNGDYVDCKNLSSFYHDPSKPQPVTSEKAALMFKGSCTGCRRMVTCPMLRENIDQFEFLALTALILFQTGLDGQSKASMDTCAKVRLTVQRELLQYYATKRVDEYSLRMGNILSILPSIQRASYKMMDDMELIYLINNQPQTNPFYNILTNLK